MLLHSLHLNILGIREFQRLIHTADPVLEICIIGTNVIECVLTGRILHPCVIVGNKGRMFHFTMSCLRFSRPQSISLES